MEFIDDFAGPYSLEMAKESEESAHAVIQILGRLQYVSAS